MRLQEPYLVRLARDAKRDAAACGEQFPIERQLLQIIATTARGLLAIRQRRHEEPYTAPEPPPSGWRGER